MVRWIKVAGWLRRTKIIEAKKVRPFRRFDIVSGGTGLPSYEKFIFFIVFACGIIQIVYGVLLYVG
mgnify:CR=1 FL=1